MDIKFALPRLNGAACCLPKGRHSEGPMKSIPFLPKIVPGVGWGGWSCKGGVEWGGVGHARWGGVG